METVAYGASSTQHRALRLHKPSTEKPAFSDWRMYCLIACAQRRLKINSADTEAVSAVTSHIMTKCNARKMKAMLLRTPKVQPTSPVDLFLPTRIVLISGHNLLQLLYTMPGCAKRRKRSARGSYHGGQYRRSAARFSSGLEECRNRHAASTGAGRSCCIVSKISTPSVFLHSTGPLLRIRVARTPA